MMLKLMQIPNMDKLKNLITNAQGNVLLELDEEVFYDLKRNDDVYKILIDEWVKTNKVKIHVFDTIDYLNFVNYMIGTSYD